MSDDRTALIIGAGMAGLCAGNYLQMNGYRTRILELHTLPGGLCTSWKRKGYTFDGCIHWLLGSAAPNPFHDLWRELIDMDALEFVDHEILMDTELEGTDRHGSRLFHWHADLDRFERYIADIAPEDSRAVGKLISAARTLQRYQLPPLIDRPKELQTLWDKLGMLRILPGMIPLGRWAKVSNLKFAAKLRNPFVREAFETIFDGREFGLLVLIFQLAYFDMKVAGYPIGGSLAFAQRFADRYTELGGQLDYGTRVEEILEDNGRAVGVRCANGTEHRADVVISAADGRWTLYEALGGRHLADKIGAAYEGGSLERFPSLLYVSLGIARSFDGPAVQRFLLDEPWTAPDGKTYARLPVHHYGYDPTLAPAGKTMLNVMLECDRFEFWDDLRRNDRAAYREAKRQVADKVIAELDARYPGLEGQVEVVDVATPATFGRYTNNWAGSYEGWLPPGNFLADNNLPTELPGLDRFFMIGQWTVPGGGLPPAIMQGRQLAQRLCHRDGRAFRVVPPAAARQRLAG